MSLNFKIILSYSLIGLLIPAVALFAPADMAIQTLLVKALAVWVFVAVVGAFFLIWSL